MKRLTFLGLLMALCAATVMPSADAQDKKKAEVTEATVKTSWNATAFKVVKQMAKDRPEKNIILGPAGTNPNTAALWYGGSPTVRAEFEKVTFCSEDTRPFVKKLLATLEDRDLETFRTSTLWCSKKVTWKDKAFEEMEDQFSTNKKWIPEKDVAKEFGGFFRQKCRWDAMSVPTAEHYPDASRLFATSTTATRGKWLYQFNKRNVARNTYYFVGDKRAEVSYMVRTAEFGMIDERDLYRCIALPIGTQGTGYALVVLPEWHEKFAGTLAKLDEVWLEKTLKALGEQEKKLNTICLPRLKLGDVADLAPFYRGLDVKTAFTKGDLKSVVMTNLTDDKEVYCEKMWAASVLDVNERGLGDVKYGEIKEARYENYLTHTYVDHPFVLIIVEGGVIVQIGIVFDPRG
jgi:serine protease inhibitor